MKNRKLIAELTMDALFIAIIFIMTFVPQFGYITIGPISITTIHIPVIIGAILLGWKRGLLYATAFGISSWIKALNAGTLVDPYFVNPVISVLPRIIFGLAIGLICLAFIKEKNSMHKNQIYTIIIAAVSTIIHTILVIGTLFLLHPNLATPVIITGLLINLAVEVGIALILTPTLYTALYKPFKARAIKYNLDEVSEDKENEF